MNAPESVPLRALAGAEPERVEQCVTQAHESGQTRWLARVVTANVEDVLRCYANAGDRDRFFWQRVDADELFCAVGSVEEVESGGRRRSSDLRKWTHDLRDRIDWIGFPRPDTAPVFVGGLSFESETSASPDWKSFPAARFVLPEMLVERVGEVGRWVLVVRVEPGATVDSVRADLDRRFEDVVTLTTLATRVDEREDDGRSTHEAPSDADDAGAQMDSSWLDQTAAAGGSCGPEYIVRADRSHARFKDQIEAALHEIETGRMAKIVLARSLSVDHDAPFDVPAFLSRLRRLYPSCTLVAVGRAKDTFLAATPEKLVRLTGREVESAALAGSAPRGRHPEEDRTLAEELLSSAKERAEHEYVVAAIRQVVESVCDEFEVSDAPALRQLVGIQHLETRLRGRLAVASDGKRAIDVLGLVEALHPTPAVGGVPSDEAASWLSRCEGLDRGWYASPIGWLDQVGGGDFRVALRSALIRNGLGPTGESGASRALLFAGAGIVEGSEPEQELVETRIKLRALLAPMTEI